MKKKREYSHDVREYNNKEYVDIYSNEPHLHDGYVDIYSSERKQARKNFRISMVKVFFSIFFLCLGSIGAIMIYFYNTLHSFKYDDLQSERPEVSVTEDPSLQLMNDSSVLNVLLIGSDSMSAHDHGRSDSLLILSLDLKHKKIKITSIMRDVWVMIPGHEKDRINAAYAYGGPKLSIETVERNFGVLIDRYAAIDFDGFSKIVDAIGGIDMELTAAECAYINKYSGDKHTLKGSGMTHLTGLQALHYSRDRNSIGSDYDRTMRQRNVIKTIIAKLKTANVAQLMDLISSMFPLITTNFKIAEITKLAASALTYLKYPVEEFRVPTDDNVHNQTLNQKMVLLINDMKKARSDLSEFIYEVSSSVGVSMGTDISTNKTSNKKST